MNAIPTNKQFRDPYYGRPGLTRFVSRIDNEHNLFLKSIRPLTGRGSGTTQTVINLILNWIINECQRRNITDVSKRHDFEQFIIEHFDVGGSVGVAMSKEHETHVGRGTPNGDTETTHTPGQRPNATRSPRRRGKGKVVHEDYGNVA